MIKDLTVDHKHIFSHYVSYIVNSINSDSDDKLYNNNILY